MEKRTPGSERDARGFIMELKDHPKYAGQIMHVQHFPFRPARTASFESVPELSEATVAALQGMGIGSLYLHQRDALLHAMRGPPFRHVLLTTGTSSGKTLAFALPLLEAFRQDPEFLVPSPLSPPNPVDLRSFWIG